jgi:hypothetical protein
MMSTGGTRAGARRKTKHFAKNPSTITMRRFSNPLDNALITHIASIKIFLKLAAVFVLVLWASTASAQLLELAVCHILLLIWPNERWRHFDRSQRNL